jgi:lipopolysaccharide/colanic/teichoic acid biosynthesis glycosyltransferase
MLHDDSKVFFIQDRPGKNARNIRVIKFRTMNEKYDSNGELLPNNERITKIGNLLRKTSLDEIPQFINVLKGEMSVVGPRPLLHKYLPLYNQQQSRRHEVKPGITGLAQVMGRNEISWSTKFEYDVYYVDNVSFCMDLKLIFLTIFKVISRRGVNSQESITMPPFNGFN